MSGNPRVRSMNQAQPEQKKAAIEPKNLINKVNKKGESLKEKKQAELPPTLSPPLRNLSAPSSLRHGSQLLRGNFSLNASCSSDASTDSSHSGASTGRISRSSAPSVRRKNEVTKLDRFYSHNGGFGKMVKVEVNNVDNVDEDELVGELGELVLKKRLRLVGHKVSSIVQLVYTYSTSDMLEKYKSEVSGPAVVVAQEFITECAVKCLEYFCKLVVWFVFSTHPSYVSFHDEEWGVPEHDDNKLFELLSLSVALAELTWPVILNKRSIFKEVFLGFDPISISKSNEKKICGPGTPGSSLLSEMKLRNIFENARQVCKIKSEFGSFDKYIWGFMNQNPIVNKFRYSRQVPAKTSKADLISKDLVRRGFRGVGPTVVYSFMQAAGLTNDHLITCFRFREHLAASEGPEKDGQTIIDVDKTVDIAKLELTRALDEISMSSD
ncbi:hypothetical protein KSS87_015235 [Heliosperma pusillum]|nr:hypothetical protein KSS87_015235 [Heliosperma pusillum]